MAQFRDLFSSHASCYARARPGYPDALFGFLAEHAAEHRLAWDVGTGNGQAATALARHFARVVGTDGSAAQIAHAAASRGVEYRVGLAEECDLEAGSVDCIAAANVVHWLDFDRFYKQVRRVAARGCVVAVWCYGLARVDDAVDAAVLKLHNDIVGPYWTEASRWIMEEYRTIPFPFAEIRPARPFRYEARWTLREYQEFLRSWSASQRYRERHGRDPVEEIGGELAEAWGVGGQAKTVSWALHLRAGRVGE